MRFAQNEYDAIRSQAADWCSGRIAPPSFNLATRPEISVVMPTFNSGHYIAEAIVSLARQDFESFELIVVDGASTDSTLDLLDQVEGIQVISEPDKGYVDAFWKGFFAAKGRFVSQCCSSDGYLDPSWLRRAWSRLESAEKVDLTWGVPARLSSSGQVLNLGFREWLLASGAVSSDPFEYWLASAMVLPEGNFVVRRHIMQEAFPAVPESKIEEEPFLVFNQRFREAGFGSAFLPVLANFGRQHEDSVTERTRNSGLLRIHTRNYQRHVARLRRQKASQDWRAGTRVYRLRCRIAMQSLARRLRTWFHSS